MRKTLLIGLVVCVVALGSIGTAFATGMGFSSVGALSLGWGTVPQINCDSVAFHLASAEGVPVTVDGVYLSFDQNFSNAAFSVSLRDAGDNELAYCALNSYSQNADQTRAFQLMTGSPPLPGPEEVYYVKVTVAGNGSIYKPRLQVAG